MEWIVAGALKATGENRQMYVNAPTQDAAFHEAAARGLLVESVSPRTGDDLARAAAAASLEYHRPAPVSAPPHYHEIQTGVVWLGIIAAVVTALGVVMVVVSVAHFGLALIRHNSAGPETSAATAIIGLYYLVAGIVHLATAAIMRMLAGLGLAVRDIARNSHR